MNEITIIKDKYDEIQYENNEVKIILKNAFFSTSYAFFSSRILLFVFSYALL